MINFLFGIHNHQPIGNFEGVFKQAYKDCYLPFVEVLEKFPKVRVSLHYTGPLLEWIEENQPEYFEKLKKLVSRNQIELMGGGFYEPLLPIIPKRDALGQLKMMQEYIKNKFGVTPRGMWLAERVWEPELPSIIAEAGLKYATIDDTHFYYAGFKAEDMFGYYVTEDQGASINVFPIDKELRYRIPFRLAEETISYFKSLPEGCGVTLADDGEKFGVWPGTHKWVYDDGYLESLFTLLTENSEWLRMLTFSEYLEQYSAKGKVYLPTASYDEMMEWSLPSESQEAFSDIVEEFKRNNQFNRLRPYLRGGFWRNFLVKYPESNEMFSKMMHVSNLIETSNKKPEIKKKARRELYRGQCNCAYWHGLFGGLYLNYLRHGIYKHLIRAENIINDGYGSAEIDYNFDGNKEILFSAPEINLYISPSQGGNIIELDYKPKEFNLSNVLTRKKEAYHSKIESAHNSNQSDQPQSIHDVVNVKEEGLKNILFYDWYRRNSLIDHILGETATFDNFCKAKYPENGDFVNQPYEVADLDKNSVTLIRKGKIYRNENEYPFSIKKTIEINKDIVISYVLKNYSNDELNLWFGIEFNLTLLSGNSKDRYYSIPDKGITGQMMNTRKELGDTTGLEIVDEYIGFKSVLEWPMADLLWRFPIETVSHSESGLERTYQGSCIMPSWKLKFGPKEEKKPALSIRIKELVDYKQPKE